MTTYSIETAKAEAHALGVAAAQTAATWTVDGDMSQKDIERRIEMLDAGDPAVWDLLPTMPNLSGEWADDPTPLSIARSVLGTDVDDQDLFDVEAELADAWETGVAETFEAACEAELRRAVA